MGTVHKFQRPPKNQGQFKGYNPSGSGGNGPGGKPPRKPGLWQRLRPWQRSVIMWIALIGVAAGIHGVGTLI